MKKLAIIRGKFLNQFEMQSFAPLVKKYDITAFGSLTPYHFSFPFPVMKLPSPMDIPEFPLKMQFLNRLFIDAHYLIGLEYKLKGFDIVHTAETYYRYTQQALNAKRTGYVKKVVATVLENIPFNNEGIWGRKAYKQKARYELDHIIALTGKTKHALLLEGTDPKKITVIGHGIDTKRFFPDTNHFNKLSKGDRTLTILYSGRLEKYKGVYEILEAFRMLQVSSKHNNCRLIYAGSGSELKGLMILERQYGLHHVVSHVSSQYKDMPNLYRKADIIAAPSKSTSTWQEQYCTVLLEAQSMGLPIVTTTSGGIPENAGDCALFCKEGDSQSLFKQLIRFIEDPELRVQYGLKARKRALIVHDSNIIARQIDHVYQNLFP